MKKNTSLALASLSFIASLALAGCGFHPVYGNRGGEGGSAVAMDLNNIAIASIPDRDGQVLRNALIDRLYAKNRPLKPQFTLKVTLSSHEEYLGILANATATRALLDMYADYTLTDAQGTELFQSKAHSVASFDKMDQMYATVASREEAHERTLVEISEQIVNRLGLYFSERK